MTYLIHKSIVLLFKDYRRADHWINSLEFSNPNIFSRISKYRMRDIYGNNIDFISINDLNRMIGIRPILVVLEDDLEFSFTDPRGILRRTAALSKFMNLSEYIHSIKTNYI